MKKQSLILSACCVAFFTLSSCQNGANTKASMQEQQRAPDELSDTPQKKQQSTIDDRQAPQKHSFNNTNKQAPAPATPSTGDANGQMNSNPSTPKKNSSGY